MKLTKDSIVISPEYRHFIEKLKDLVLTARLSAARAVSRDLILLYWEIGRGIVEKQQTLEWGESVVNRISRDLREAFPGTTGFSPRNLRSMKQFYLAYSDPAIWLHAVAKLKKIQNEWIMDIWRQPVAKLTDEKICEFLWQLIVEIPWGHHLLILNKINAPAVRLYYLRATASFGWSRNVLLNQIKAGAYERAVVEKKTHNFELVLPERLAEQAGEMLKSSYSREDFEMFLDYRGLNRRSSRTYSPERKKYQWSSVIRLDSRMSGGGLNPYRVRQYLRLLFQRTPACGSTLGLKLESSWDLNSKVYGCWGMQMVKKLGG